MIEVLKQGIYAVLFQLFEIDKYSNSLNGKFNKYYYNS